MYPSYLFIGISIEVRNHRFYLAYGDFGCDRLFLFKGHNTRQATVKLSALNRKENKGTGRYTLEALAKIDSGAPQPFFKKDP
jgi:hypothetical protein